MEKLSQIGESGQIISLLVGGEKLSVGLLVEKENYDMFLYGNRERGGEVPNGMGRGGGIWAWHKSILEEKEKRMLGKKM